VIPFDGVVSVTFYATHPITDYFLYVVADECSSVFVVITAAVVRLYAFSTKQVDAPIRVDVRLEFWLSFPISNL